MLARSLALSLVATTWCAAQTFSVPDADPTTGNCNVIPFGSTTVGSFANQRYQQLVTAADLGNTPGPICDLRFASCYGGDGTRRFSRLVVQLNHTSATTLSSSFSQNLGTGATVVLDATDHVWNSTGDDWNSVGLRIPFVYNGADNLIVDIEVQNAIANGGSGSPGFHRSARQRAYRTGYAGGDSASVSNAALKIQVVLGDASGWTFGRGCTGTNGDPSLRLSGFAQFGANVTVDLERGPVNSVAALNVGVNAFTGVYPVDLGAIGAPGCLLYVDPGASGVFPTGASGTASAVIPVPNDPRLWCLGVYCQWVGLDPMANAAGATTSSYGWLLLGN